MIAKAQNRLGKPSIMRRVAALFLAIVLIALLASVMPPRAAHAEESGTCGDNLTWRLDGGTLTISGTGEMDDWDEYTNPPWHDYLGSITNIVIENGVTTVGDRAFTSYIGLMSVVIPNSVVEIGTEAFSGTSLTSVVIPNSVLVIEAFAFSKCDGLTTIELPASVEMLGTNPFSECNNLQSIQVSDENTVFSSVDGLLLNKNRTRLIIVPGAVTSVTIPDTVTSIESHAFDYCSKLTNVEFHDNVTNIGQAAFYRCSNLSSVTILSAVMRIGVDAFWGCENLADIYYCSTKTDWDAIEKGNDWDKFTPENKEIHYSVAVSAAVSPDASGSVAITADPSAPASPVEGEYWSGTSVTLTATPVEGLAFVSWTSEDVAKIDGATDAEVTFDMPDDDVTVTANFGTPKGKLTFDLGGGTLDGKTGTITIEAEIGETINLPSAPTRDGYTFKCWRGSEYAAGAEYVVEGDHAFTAEWEKNAEPTAPAKTGDATASVLGVLMLVAIASLCAMTRSAARRREN